MQKIPQLIISKNTMHRFRLLFITLALIIAAAEASPQKNALLNKPAPPFALASLDNQRIDLAALRGRVVLLNFWATWCAGCRIEMPRFVQWQQKYQAEGLSIVGVSMDDDSAPAAELAHKLQLNYPVVMGDEHLGIQYGGVLGLPVTFLIDRQGIIRSCFQGAADLNAMETAVRKILRKP